MPKGDMKIGLLLGGTWADLLKPIKEGKRLLHNLAIVKLACLAEHDRDVSVATQGVVGEKRLFSSKWLQEGGRHGNDGTTQVLETCGVRVSVGPISDS